MKWRTAFPKQSRPDYLLSGGGATSNLRFRGAENKKSGRDLHQLDISGNKRRGMLPKPGRGRVRGMDNSQGERVASSLGVCERLVGRLSEALYHDESNGKA